MLSNSTLEKKHALGRLRAEDNACRRCAGKNGPKYVFGTGNPDAGLVFVGEAPGLSEDRAGEPFVGRAGALLDRLIDSIGLERRDVYITNVVKCHPMRDPSRPRARGNDRKPTRAETKACLPVLEREIALIGPEIICTLGNTATQSLLATREGTKKLHGVPHFYRGIPLLPTFHPAAALRDPRLEKYLYEDMKKVKDLLKRTAGRKTVSVPRGAL